MRYVLLSVDLHKIDYKTARSDLWLLSLLIKSNISPNVNHTVLILKNMYLFIYLYLSIYVLFKLIFIYNQLLYTLD